MKQLLLLLTACLLATVSISCDDNPEFQPITQKTTSPQITSDKQQVTTASAIDVATIFASKNLDIVQGRSETSVCAITDSAYNLIAYAVNFGSEGWVMVSATKQYHPILAYSEVGQFVNPLVKTDYNGYDLWLNEVSCAINDSALYDISIKEQIASEWNEYNQDVMAGAPGGIPGGYSPEAIACRNRLKELNETYYTEGWSFTTLPAVTSVKIPNYIYTTADEYSSPYEYTIVGLRNVGALYSVSPLLNTTWKQQDYKETNRYYAGCVPIAMAQIMKFHQYPTDFRWLVMTNDPKDMVVMALLSDIRLKTGSIQVNFPYTDTNEEAAFEAFYTYGYAVSENDKSVFDEIYENRRPVYMQGASTSIVNGQVVTNQGHAWVCDGVNYNNPAYDCYVEYLHNGAYDNLGKSLEYPQRIGETLSAKSYFHMNWGDSFLSDGWYIKPQPTEAIHYTERRKNLFVYPKNN